MKVYSRHFQLSKELGKELHEVMGWRGPMTSRQFKVWNKWLDKQWNEPSRTDHYLMRIALETRLPHIKEGSSLDLDSFKIHFKEVRVSPPSTRTQYGEDGSPLPLRNQEEDIEITKAIIKARLGVPIRITPPTSPTSGG